MNQHTILTVRNGDLDRLDPGTAVEFFQKLLWAEARRLGMEISKVNISRWVNVPDGGVDATVEDAQFGGGQGLIKLGKTSYQIKAGASFKPWQKLVIKGEFFGTKPLGRQNLGESIRACLDTDGTYVLVCTGIDLVDSQLRNAREHIKEFLNQCGYSHPKVEVWSQNTLIGFLEIFPSLALYLNERGDTRFQSHRNWSRHADMRVPYVPGQSRDSLIAEIQDELRVTDRAAHIRVGGEPGIGKTRLVFEATESEDLSPLVIYCRSAAQFESSRLMNAIHYNDHLSAIVVIDECEPSTWARIWNELKHCGPRIKLITIYNDCESQRSDVAYYVVPPLELEQIRSIIQEYTGIPDDQADRWGELCSGSPRVAHVIGENLVNHPDDLLKPPSTVDIWERYIAAGDRPDSEKTERRRLVLQHLALFKRFGYEADVAKESDAIAEKIEAADRDITSHEFENIIYELRERRILQGESTLYITPKALQIWLWTQWWERHHRRFDLQDFTKDLTLELVEWFYDMFVYAAESEAALEIVEKLLGPNGPFQDNEYLKTRLGSRFFLALTEANPSSALRCLMRTIGTWDREALLEFRDGRRSIVWALEKIAVWRELFTDAARLLLKLGEAENEVAANNASGVFAKLFSLGSGSVAPTEASPAERFPIIEEAFQSGSKEQRALALDACSEGLEAYHFSRISGAEYQGLRQEPELWTPQTHRELFDAYRRVWKLLSAQLTRFPEDERQKAADILLQHVRGLVKSSEMSNMVVNTLRTFAEQALVDEKQLIKTVSEFLHYEGKDLPDDIRHCWEHLRDEWVGSDFHSMMQRYVGMSLLVDRVGENSNRVDRAQPHIEKLAQQAVDMPILLQPELPWLVTTEAEEGYRFGYELAKRDEGFTFLPALLEARRNATDNASEFFLGGYFRVVSEQDVAYWESQLDALVVDTTLNVLIPQITRYSGMTDQAGLRILKLAKRGIIGINHFNVFSSGRVIEHLSDEVFTQWIEFLLRDIDESTISMVLRLYHHYHILLKPEPTLSCDLAFRLLTHPILFQEASSDVFYRVVDHDWTEIGKAFLNLYPEKSLALAELMLANFGKSGTIVEAHFQTRTVLTEITKRFPAEMWEHISEYLERRDDFLRTHYLERWLTGENTSDSASTDTERGTLPLMPREKIWEWIDGNIEERAKYLASTFGPSTLSVDEWQTSLARDLLVRYGDREVVRNHLRANYAIEVSWGPESLHLDRKKQELLRISEAEVNAENNANVKQWVDRYVEELDADIEHAKIREERQF